MTTSDALDRFFSDYGAALAAGDLEQVARAYSYPSLVLGGPETILVSDPDAVKEAFAGAAEQHREQGFVRAEPSIRVLDEGGVGVTWVAVDWTYSSEDGARTERDAHRYLVIEVDGAPAIAALAAAEPA